MSVKTIECDVAIVGAGPAGLAAASVCARAGLDALVLDENPTPGGQVHRAVTTTPLTDPAILGKDYWRGMRLVDEFRRSGARYQPQSTVWSMTPDLELAVSTGGETTIVSASSVILATGAIERPFPIPG